MRRCYWEEWDSGNMVGLLITGGHRGDFEQRMDPEFQGGETIKKYVIEFSFCFPNGETEWVTATREGSFGARIDPNYFSVPRAMMSQRDELLRRAEEQAEAIFQKAKRR